MNEEEREIIFLVRKLLIIKSLIRQTVRVLDE